MSAGNSGRDACQQSPARVAPALTVGATDSADAKASFSNFGRCVDLFAPGVAITSAWATGSDATKTISGTSMSSPHVAGVAALFLAKHPGSTPSAVASALVAGATANQLSSIGKGSPNRLLFTAY